MRQIIIALVVVNTFSAVCSAQKTVVLRPVMSVCLYNLTGVPARVVGIGKDLAGQILSNGGIDVRWTDVAAPKGDVEIEQCAGIHIIVTRVHPGAANGPMARGAAVEGVGWAFYDRVESLVDHSSKFLLLRESPERAKGEVLGVVIAHEIGHVLKLPHSRQGIMRAELAPEDFLHADNPKLQFTREDARQLAVSLTTLSAWALPHAK